MVNSWKWNRLLVCHLLIALLVGSLLWPVTKQWWHIVDVAAFKFLNQTFLQAETGQRFWALVTHSTMDWIEDLLFLLLFGVNFFKAPPEKRKQCIVELLFCIFFIALTIILMNRLLFRDLLSIKRLSPTLTVDTFINLSDHLLSLDFKTHSSKSFPGDHATTALLCGSLVFSFVTRPLGLLGGVFALFFCLPRLIFGAHWLSDVLVGSFSVVIFAVCWGFCTPFQKKMCSFIEKLLFSKKESAVKMDSIEQVSGKD